MNSHPWGIARSSMLSPITSISDKFIGSVEQGGFVNFRNLIINPHGNCTHTESVGHISNEAHSVNNILNKHHFISQLISVNPKKLERDIIQADEKKVRIEMRENKDKEDLKDVKAIIKDLEKNNG